MAGHVEFEISTGNLIIGTFTWVFIASPEGWALRRGGLPPDIFYTTRIGDRGWVLEGEARYFLTNLVNGEVLELEVRCRKRPSIPDDRYAHATIVNVAGHSAKVLKQTINVGLLRKKTMSQMKLIVPCDVTERTVELTFTAQQEGRGLEEVAEALSRCRCH